MPKILFSICCIICPSFFLGQDTLVKFLNSDFKIVQTKEEASFVAYVTKVENGYAAKIYYGRENIAMEGVFKDKKLTQRNGLFKIYYASTSRIMMQGNYDYNIQNGVWQTWYENGKCKDSGKLYYGKKVGPWKMYYENGKLLTNSKYADSFSTPSGLTKNIAKEDRPTAIADYLEQFFDETKIGLWETFYDNGMCKDSINYIVGEKEGTAKQWYKNGNLESIGAYGKDFPMEEWKWFYENGNIATIEQYKNGKIVKMQCTDSTGKFISDYCSINKPAMFPGGITKFDDYVKQKVKYPEDAKPYKHEAIVNCIFTIDKNGKVKNIRFGASPIIYFYREIENALYAMPTWEVAIMHNRVVEYDIQLAVPFVLPK